MTEVIASRDNERVKRACKLRDSGARRAAEGRFLAEGLRLCTDLAQRLPPEEVYCTQKLLDAHPELAALGGRHFLVSDAVAAKLSDTKAPQGLFCVFPRRTKTLEAVRGGGRYVCLEHIQDPANVGALLRSAASCAGVKTMERSSFQHACASARASGNMLSAMPLFGAPGPSAAAIQSHAVFSSSACARAPPIATPP